MKLSIETKFNPGDKVWRKNLVTNEAFQTKIKIVQVYVIFDGERQSYIEVYYDEQSAAPMTNIPGEISANNAFATKEEADACPAYVPEEY